MTPFVPTLGRRDVEGELELVHAVPHRSKHLALFGQADHELQAAPFADGRWDGQPLRFRVVEAGSELALRRALAFAAPEDALVLLVTYGLDVPSDIAARIAKGQVLQIDRARRVAARFRARSVNAEVLLEKPLVDALLDEGGDFDPIPGLALDLPTAWRALLARLTGARSVDFASGEQVLAFAATAPGGPDFARRAARWPGLLQRLHAWLEERAGRIGGIAWRAWERDEGTRVAALAFVLEPLAAEVPRNGFVRGRLASVLEAIHPDLAGAEADAELLRQWGALAGPLYFQLEAAGVLGDALAQAERLFPADPEVDAALVRSRYLPRALLLAQRALALALRRALEQPGDREALRDALALHHQLEEHRQAQAEAQRSVVERARMALRLLAWRELSGRAALDRAEAAPEAERVPILAAWYAREGAFVDHARRLSRGAVGDELGAAIAAVVEAASALRDAYDAAFARALPHWLSRNKHPTAVPIEDALARFAVPFLEADPNRKLLVLLLDGMAWANACALLLDFDPHGFAPTRHQASPDGSRLLPPMLAALPSTTEVSRSAFFAGRLPRPGEKPSTGADPDRFASHAALVKVLGGRSPRLLLSADVDDPSGGASKRARELVGSDDRVVGLVLNAIDDTLRSGTQARFLTGVDDIRPLRDVLQAARAAGRAILLASDHGHIPGNRLAGVPVPETGGARWRGLAAGEEPRGREVVFGGDRAWRPRGKERLALLWSETETYSSASSEGVHGGASLAEVVAPAVFVAHESLAGELRALEGDGPAVEELEVMAYPRPSFWSLELPRAELPASAARRSREQKAQTTQVAMKFAQAPQQAAVPSAPAPAAPPEVELLAASPVFKAMLERRPRLKQRKDLILAAVAALFEAEGQLSPERFAVKVGTVVGRVQGVVALVQEAVNVDGFPVLVHDPREKLVKLDRETFRSLFKEDAR